MTGEILVLLGPTACGKTVASLPLAERLGAEIVSVDSRQIFRGMEIGSAAPTAAERARVRHHLVSEVDPILGMSAGEYGRRARLAIADIGARGLSALLVGGSGLYLRAALGGLDDVAPGEAGIRESLRSRLAAEGPVALHAELVVRDPETAARTSPRDAQRILRALEILAVTGERPSELRRTGRKAETAARIVVLDRTSVDLGERIRRRAVAMAEAGLAAEVESLLARGLDPGSPLMKSLGYPETIRYLAGELDREAWIDAVSIQTRRFAKRQRTWFRGLGGAVWVPLEAGEEPETAISRILAGWGEA